MLFFAKVAAHVAEEDCDSSLDEWFSIGNSAADRAAKQANVGRPDEVWCLWERHASEVCGNRRLAASIRQHQVAVCRLWTDQFGHLSSKEAPTQPKPARIFAKGFQHAGAEVEVCPPLVKLLGHCFTELLKHWWVDAIDLTIPDADIEWVSFVHLFVAFQQVTGHPGLIRKGRRWVDPWGDRLLLPHNFAFQVRARWFRMCLQQAWKCWRSKVKTAVTRPAGDMIVGHFGCCSVPLRKEVLHRADQWLRSKLRGPVRGTGSALSSLPVV